MRCIILIFFIFVLMFSGLQADSAPGLYSRLPINPVFSRLGVEEGLSQGTVYAIAQDKNGFLWFGTESGLNRYDSRGVRIFNTLNSGLRDSRITALATDQFGSLWVGTEKGGLHHIITNGDEVRFISLPKGIVPGDSTHISSIVADVYGTIWIAAAKSGLFRCEPTDSPETDSIKPVELTTQNSSMSVSPLHLTSLHFDSSSTLWIGTRQHGLYRIDPHHNPQASYSLEAIALNGDLPTVQPPSILDVQSDLNGALWIATEQGLYSYNPQTHRATRRWNETVELIIRDLYLDRRGALWMATDGAGIALIQADSPDQPVTYFTHIPGLSSSLSTNATEVIFEDSFGVIWIGTFRAGLNRLVLSGNDPKIRHRPPFILLPEAITLDGVGLFPNAGINSIVEDRDASIWLGTEHEGVIRLSFPESLASVPTLTQIKLPPKKGIPSPTVVTSLALTQDGWLWIGTYTDGMYRLPSFAVDSNDRGLVHLPADMSRNQNSPPHPFISALLCSDEGDLWVGTIGGGLSCIRHGTSRFEHAPLDSESDTTLSDRSILSLFMDKSKRLWIGTAFGLNLIKDPSLSVTDALIVPIRSHPGVTPALLEQAISAIFQDDDGLIWVGTQNNGLFRIDELQDNLARFTQYTTRDGLGGDLVASITKDLRGHLWISTNNGISSFIPAQNHFVSFSTAHGLPSTEFFRAAFCRLSGGDLLFGSHKGAILFNPLALLLDPNPPLLTFRNLSYRDAGQDLKTERLHAGKTLRLGTRNFPISISFSAIHSVSSEHTLRVHQLKKIDNDWQKSPDSQSVSYPTLPAGTYHFLFKAANHDGLWTPAPIEFTLIISPPFWRSIPFLATLVFLLALTLTALHFWRIGKAVKRERQKYEKTFLSLEQKEQFIKIISDHARQSLCFTDPELTLSKFSTLVDIPAHNVSQAINSTLNMSFPDFINELRIEHAKRLMDKAIEEGRAIRFSDLFASAGFSSQATFNRTFKKIVSVTPGDYHSAKKIFRAKELLCEDGCAALSLSDIAVKAGFATESALIRLFKAQEGITPLQYRKQNGAKKKTKKHE